MAIVALRCFDVSELRHLPMIRFEIGVRDVLVAATTLVHDVQPEIGDVRALNRVRRMTFAASRLLLPCFRHLRRVDAADELFVDAAVTF